MYALWNMAGIQVISLGHAVAQRLDAGFPSQQPRFAYVQHVGFVVDKAALGQVFSEYFNFPCQSFHRFLTHTKSIPWQETARHIIEWIPQQKLTHRVDSLARNCQTHNGVDS
jgi:hypothetical protein